MLLICLFLKVQNPQNRIGLLQVSVTYPLASCIFPSPLHLYSKSVPYQSIWHCTAHLVLLFFCDFAMYYFWMVKSDSNLQEQGESHYFPALIRHQLLISSKSMLQGIWNLVEHKQYVNMFYNYYPVHAIRFSSFKTRVCPSFPLNTVPNTVSCTQQYREAT